MLFVICSTLEAAEGCCSEGMLSSLRCASSCESYLTISADLGVQLVETREHNATTVKRITQTLCFH